MQAGLNTLQNIGLNYAIKLNEKEYLVVENDDLRNPEGSKTQKLQKSSSPDQLSEGEKKQLQELQARDAEVKAHEAAHQSAGASAGAASFSYQQGPDGKMYAIGGEVPISFKEGSTPQETIQNARAVQAAAMAPADPSPQDYAVAASARVMEMKAQQKLTQQHQEQILGKETYKNDALQNQDSENTLDIPA